MSGTENTEPGTFQVTVTAYRCRCGHEWIARTPRQVERPRVCPKCKSANWDQPYRLQKTNRGKPKES